jgi:hypothetical protein
MARHTINQKFVENLHRQSGTGKYQEFADDALRGFGVKVTPQGGITITTAGRHQATNTLARRWATIPA